MSDFEQRLSDPQRSSARSDRPVPATNSVSGPSMRNFQSFPQKRLAMQQLLRTIAERRISQGVFHNPWAGWSDDQFDTYTEKVIDQLQKIRKQDLSVAYAIYLEGKDGNKPPQERQRDLEAALEVARERGKVLKGKAKASNRAYQHQLERDIRIQKALYTNRADLRGDDDVSKSNVSTLLLEAQEKPGYVRAYMTVFAPSSNDKHKDLHRDAAGRIVGRSDQLWLNFGSPARALSYVTAYRLTMDPSAMPLVRSMLVPMSFLEEHLPRSTTENEKEKEAIEGWARYERVAQVNARQEKVSLTRVQPPMNTDT